MLSSAPSLRYLRPRVRCLSSIDLTPSDEHCHASRPPLIIADACAKHGRPERRLLPIIADHSADYSAAYR